MEQNKKKVGFYGGTIGPWLPMLAMIVLMLLVTAAPVAIGYWISKKTARLQNPETK